MPWKETNVSNLRTQFIGLYKTGDHPISDLCRSFGISRKTGHKLINEFNENGAAALFDKSSAPHNHPNATPTEIEDLIKECRSKHPKWGPKKLKARLAKQFPETNWPAVSTIGEILRRNGLTIPKKRKYLKGLDASASPLLASGANDTWCADFKGQFVLGNGKWCYPLTITDACSRMILRSQCLAKTNTENVKPIFVAAFMEYGLPEAIRTDNGPPFASIGLGGLTPLSVWWMRLGIRLDRIEKSHPEQNGRHERMHREMKACVPIARDMNSQQRAFDKFCDEYNNIRPHEALGMATPGSLYVVSQREYPVILPDIEYPEGMIVRKVRHDGCIRWKRRMLYLSEALQCEPVGLDQVDDRHFVIYYGTMPLAVIDDLTCQLLPRQQATKILKNLREE